MSRDEVTSKVLSIVSEVADIPESDLSTSTSLSEAGADSLTIVEIAIAIEEEFAIDIGDLEPDSIETVQELIDTVCQHLE